MRRLIQALALGLSQGLAGSGLAAPAETMTAEAFVSRCVAPMELGGLPDLSGLPTIGSYERAGRELSFKDLPGPATIKEMITQDGLYAGCSVESERGSHYDAQALEVAFDAWADRMVADGRYTDLSNCPSAEFAYGRAIQFNPVRPNGLKLRVLLAVHTELHFFMFVVAETDGASDSCEEMGTR